MEKEAAMNGYRLPFRYECMLVVVLCTFVVMCGEDPDSITVSIQNSCTDNVKLKENGEHISPGEIKENVLSLTKELPKDSFSIWRQEKRLAEFEVTGTQFPEEGSIKANKEMMDITSEDTIEGFPFDDIFSATPIQNYVTVIKTYQYQYQPE
jgi:hypothetical protein